MSPEMSNRSLGIKDFYSKIGKASDVFQMASVFWFIVNKRHPSGIIEESDWSGPSELFPVLKRALEHCPKRRTLDGGAFFEQLAEALNA
jgi:serine/threonine-protein kinase